MGFNIWSACPKVPITELLECIVDNRGKTVPTTESGHKLIATNCVTNNTLFLESIAINLIGINVSIGNTFDTCDCKLVTCILFPVAEYIVYPSGPKHIFPLLYTRPKILSNS